MVSCLDKDICIRVCEKISVFQNMDFDDLEHDRKRRMGFHEQILEFIILRALLCLI